jgi:hypothetical protein
MVLWSMRPVAPLVAVCVACGDATGPNTPALIPLDVGNSWTYQIVDSVELGVKEPVSPPPQFTMRVASETTIEGERWAFLEQSIFDLTANDGAAFVRNAEDGFWTIQELGASQPIPALKLPYPTQLGALGGFVQSLDTTIVVPAGTFRCIRYGPPDHQDGNTYFVAPGVGVVKKVFSPFDVKDVFTAETLYRLYVVYELKSYFVLRQ